MTKYQEMYTLMAQKHEALFKAFRPIHDKYVLEPEKYKAEFDTVGRDVMDVITSFENRLCNHSEKGRYAVYSSTLSDKFWALVRQEFPKIDDVGVEITYETKQTPVSDMVDHLTKTTL